MRRTETVGEALRILGLMQWVMYLQYTIFGLYLVNFVLALVLLLSPDSPWMESLSAVASVALVGTSRLAFNYHRRLRRALDDLLHQRDYGRPT